MNINEKQIINRKELQSHLDRVYGFIMDPNTTIDDFKHIETDIQITQAALNQQEIKGGGWGTSFKHNNEIKQIKSDIENILASILTYKKIDNKKEKEKFNIIFNLKNLVIKETKTINACIHNNPELFEKIISKIPNDNWDAQRNEKIIKISYFITYKDDLAKFLIKNKPEQVSYFFNIEERKKAGHKKYHECLNAQYNIWSLALKYNPDAIPSLVKQGFDINACQVLTHSNEINLKRENNVLSSALKYFSVEKIQLVLDNKFLYREDEWEDETPYDYVFYGRWNVLCQTLYDNGIKPSNDWINEMIFNQNENIIEIIENIPLSIDNLKQATITNSKLIPAILNNNPNILKEQKEENNTSILSSVVTNKSEDTANKEELFWLLVKHGATVNHTLTKKEGGTFPIHLIEQLSFHPITDEIFDYVLKHSQDFLLEKQNNKEFSLNKMIFKPEYLKKMLEAGFDPNTADNEKRTPLMDAVGTIYVFNTSKIPEYYSEEEKNIQISKEENKYSIFKTSFEYLLENSADINIRNKSRETAIFECRHPEILIELVKKGAKYNIKNRKKQSVISALQDKGHQDLASVLQEYILKKEININTKPQPRRMKL